MITKRTPINCLSWAAKETVKLPVRFYRRFISPFKPPVCKYYPSCSCYALDALEKHGVIKGAALSVWRIMRCNPWSRGGVDYVPEKFTFRRQKRSYKSK